MSKVPPFSGRKELFTFASNVLMRASRSLFGTGCAAGVDGWAETATECRLADTIRALTKIEVRFITNTFKKLFRWMS
jgi:hypothetical protein